MALQRLIDLSNVEEWLRKIFSAVQYARTSSDQLRVNVDNAITISAGQSVNVNAGNQTGALSGLTIVPFNSNSWNAMDARETAREASEQHFVLTRQRWTIS